MEELGRVRFDGAQLRDLRNCDLHLQSAGISDSVRFQSGDKDWHYSDDLPRRGMAVAVALDCLAHIRKGGPCGPVWIRTLKAQSISGRGHAQSKRLNVRVGAP